MNRLEQKKTRRVRRKKHVRKLITGVGERPRMTVYKSGRYLYVSASNLEKDLRKVRSNIAGAEQLGQVIGGRLKEKKISSVVFDRNGYAYHGIVKSIAEGTRKAGIQF